MKYFILRKVFFYFLKIKKTMANSSKLERIKKLETLVALQKDCLDMGDWDNFDEIEGEVKKLEGELAGS